MNHKITPRLASNAITSRLLLIALCLLGFLSLLIPVQADDYVIHVHTDHLGNPIAYTNEQGVVIQREYYSPYGQALNPDNQLDDDSAGYTGHVSDSDTGLVYMQARYYDPAIGRFLSTDPVTYAAGGGAYFNRYSYVANSPMNFVDPTGMYFVGADREKDLDGDGKSANNSYSGPEFEVKEKLKQNPDESDSAFDKRMNDIALEITESNGGVESCSDAICEDDKTGLRFTNIGTNGSHVACASPSSCPAGSTFTQQKIHTHGWGRPFLLNSDDMWFIDHGYVKGIKDPYLRKRIENPKKLDLLSDQDSKNSIKDILATKEGPKYE